MNHVVERENHRLSTITLVDTWRPAARNHALLYDGIIVIAASLLMAILAQIRIPVAISPVPITGQTLGVILLGTLLGRIRGALAMLAYLLEGIAGLPVFAGGAAGLAYFIGPTGGFLIGFVAGAFVCGYLAEKGWNAFFLTSVAAMILGLAAVYYFGLSWMLLYVDSGRLFKIALIPFIPGEMIKIIAASLLLPLAWRVWKK